MTFTEAVTEMFETLLSAIIQAQSLLKFNGFTVYCIFLSLIVAAASFLIVRYADKHKNRQ